MMQKENQTFQNDKLTTTEKRAEARYFYFRFERFDLFQHTVQPGPAWKKLYNIQADLPSPCTQDAVLQFEKMATLEHGRL